MQKSAVIFQHVHQHHLRTKPEGIELGTKDVVTKSAIALRQSPNFFYNKVHQQ